MKKVVFLVLALALVLGFQSPLFAAKPEPKAPDISGIWLFDVIGGEKGGLLLQFDAAVPNPDTGAITASFQGYGFTMGDGAINFTGGPECLTECSDYTVDTKGKITGTYFMSNGTGTFTGKVDKKATKISIKIAGGPNLKGTRLPEGLPPAVEGDWFVTGSGQGGYSVTIDRLVVAPSTDPALPHRIYTISGLGTANDPVHPNVQIEGGFFLTSKNIAYGFYTVTDQGAVDPFEGGIFTGKINLSSMKFVFKLISTQGDKATMKGEALF